MKKKMISGLFVGLLIGTMGFVTVSEAIGQGEEERMDSYEMKSRHERHREIMNNQLTDEKKQDQVMSEDEYYGRRQNGDQNHMRKTRGRHQSRMNGYCW